MTSDNRTMTPEIGAYCLATKYADGEGWDHWAVGFYVGEIFPGRYQVTGNEGQFFRHNGFRRVEEISQEQGQYIIDNAKVIEETGMKLWDYIHPISPETVTKEAPTREMNPSDSSITPSSKSAEVDASARANHGQERPSNREAPGFHVLGGDPITKANISDREMLRQAMNALSVAARLSDSSMLRAMLGAIIRDMDSHIAQPVDSEADQNMLTIQSCLTAPTCHKIVRPSG